MKLTNVWALRVYFTKMKTMLQLPVNHKYGLGFMPKFGNTRTVQVVADKAISVAVVGHLTLIKNIQSVLNVSQISEVSGLQNFP